MLGDNILKPEFLGNAHTKSAQLIRVTLFLLILLTSVKLLKAKLKWHLEQSEEKLGQGGILRGLLKFCKEQSLQYASLHSSSEMIVQTFYQH